MLLRFRSREVRAVGISWHSHRKALWRT